MYGCTRVCAMPFPLLLWPLQRNAHTWDGHWLQQKNALCAHRRSGRKHSAEVTLRCVQWCEASANGMRPGNRINAGKMDCAEKHWVNDEINHICAWAASPVVVAIANAEKSLVFIAQDDWKCVRFMVWYLKMALCPAWRTHCTSRDPDAERET